MLFMLYRENSEDEDLHDNKQYMELSKIDKNTSENEHFVENNGSFDGIVGKYTALDNLES